MTIAEDRQRKALEDRTQALKGLAAAILGTVSHAFAIGVTYKELSKALDAVYDDIAQLQTQKAVNEAAGKNKVPT